jgi:phage gp29-like protein
LTTLLDQYGRPIKIGDLKEPQTAHIARLQHEVARAQIDGLSPERAARILREADAGDIVALHRLFDDMYDRDAHLRCEYDKRAGALLGLDWSIVPPAGASPAERRAAEHVEGLLRDAVDDIEDVLLAMMEAVGHGFAPIELQWQRWGNEWLPRFHPRPQTWFRTSLDHRRLVLDNGTGDGEDPRPMGWIFHEHVKVKTGYLGRMGLSRAILWPFLYKAYSLGDFAEFLETYGLPIILGKYMTGASGEEKASLMRAVAALGRDARAIMPSGMEIEIQKITGSADATPHLALMNWADAAESKLILGQVLSADAKATGMGSGVANLHGEVRHDILCADARQVAGTLTRDLVYPLIALNRGGVDGLSRCPRWVFDTGEASDITAYAEALPKLVGIGLRVPEAWAHEKLRIPEPAGDEPVLGIVQAVPPEPGGEPGKKPGAAEKYDAGLINAYSMGVDRFARLGVEIPEGFIRDVFGLPAPKGGEKVLTPPVNEPGAAALKSALAAAKRRPTDPIPDTRSPIPDDEPWVAAALPRLAADADPAIRAWLDRVEAMLEAAGSLDEFRETLLAAWDSLPPEELTEALAEAIVAAELAGRAEIGDGRNG